MYHNQYVRVSFNGISGKFWKLGNGVKQRAVLSPLLFCFYVNEVLLHLNKLNIGCRIGLHMHNGQAYADDFTLQAPSATALQKLLDKISNMFSKLNLNLNVSKSVCMIFNSKSKGNLPKLVLNNCKLDIVSEYKYLGIIFSDSLNEKFDILRCERAFLRQFYAIYRRFHFVDSKILKFLFKTHCLSMYGADL